MAKQSERSTLIAESCCSEAIVETELEQVSGRRIEMQNYAHVFANTEEEKK